jgi:hypothetical protein
MVDLIPFVIEMVPAMMGNAYAALQERPIRSRLTALTNIRLTFLKTAWSSAFWYFDYFQIRSSKLNTVHV